MFNSLRNYERFRRIVSLVAPNRCPFCGEVLDSGDYWCGECYRYLPFVHGIVPPSDNISALYACCFYTGRARDAVLMLKYGGLVYPADAFAVMMSDRLCGAEADMLVPVPNGRAGVLKRGFSSSELIAERLAMRVGIPMVNALIAFSSKREQKSLNAENRRKNALNSFYVDKRVSVKGKRIILIDEVTTTGSTLSAVGELLRGAGAEDVSAAVFAKTVEFKHGQRKRYTIRKR